MKRILIAATFGVLLLLGGCAVVVSPTPALVTQVRWDGNVANSGVSARKSGESCARNILGLYASGDASIEAAKKAGGITKVATVDHRTNNILFVYGEYCTVVTGE